MKSTMPFRGVAAPALRAICRSALAAHPLAEAAAWRSTALCLWREATYREERYAAIELTGARQYRGFQSLDTLSMYEEMIVTGAWWDFVDVLASHRLGGLLAAFPAPMTRRMKRWSRDADLWRRRAAILSQLTFKSRTDLELLYACIEPNLGGSRVLHPQGHRVGAARLRVDRPRRGRPVRRRERRSPEPAQPARGAQEHRARHLGQQDAPVLKGRRRGRLSSAASCTTPGGTADR